MKQHKKSKKHRTAVRAEEERKLVEERQEHLRKMREHKIVMDRLARRVKFGNTQTIMETKLATVMKVKAHDIKHPRGRHWAYIQHAPRAHNCPRRCRGYNCQCECAECRTQPAMSRRMYHRVMMKMAENNRN